MLDDTLRRGWVAQVAQERADQARTRALAHEAHEAEAAARPFEKSRWLGLQVRSLLALVAVAEEGSFVGAARRLGYSRSTISHQIAQLEAAVRDVARRPRQRLALGARHTGRRRSSSGTGAPSSGCSPTPSPNSVSSEPASDARRADSRVARSGRSSRARLTASRGRSPGQTRRPALRSRCRSGGRRRPPGNVELLDVSLVFGR